MSSLAIIIPCFNESGRLDQDAFKEFASAHPDIPFYFINDGSTDHTGRLLSELSSAIPGSALIELAKNKGKGEAIRTAMLAVGTSYQYVGYLDADLSTSLGEFYRLYQTQMISEVPVALASRIKKADTTIERSYARHLIGRTIATVIDKRFQLGCYDTQCGAKIFDTALIRDIITQPFLTRWFFDVELFLRIKKRTGKFNALEVPLTHWKNVKNSKLNVLSCPLILKELYLLLSKY